jgi:glutathione S-transferase
MPITEPIKFVNKAERADFLRRMRLLSEDVAELAQSVAILLALARRADDQALIAALNRNALFWNTILSALQTTIFVIMGRIHDTSPGGAYFSEIKKFLKTRKAAAEVLARFDKLHAVHQKLVGRMVKLRQKVFAHAAFDRPLHDASGFKDLDWDKIEAYCRELAGATVALEQAIFPGDYEPKHDPNLLQQSIEHADKALDAIRDAA